MRPIYRLVAAGVVVAGVAGGAAAFGRQDGVNAGPVRVETVSQPVAAVSAFRLARFSLAQKQVHGGYRTKGTVFFSRAAATAVTVKIAGAGLKVPRTVKVRRGARSGSFWIGTPTAAKKVTRTVRASYGKTTLKRSLAVLPLPVPKRLSLSVPKITAGGSLTATVRLSGAAQPGGSRITLSSEAASVRVPGSVVVKAGARTASFKITSVAGSPARKVTITARRGSARLTASLRVVAAPAPSQPASPQPTSPTPAPSSPPKPTPTPTSTPTQQPEPAGPEVSGLLVDPWQINTGESGKGTVTLDGPAPAGGTKVTLSITEAAEYAKIPATVTVPAGESSADFIVTAVAPADDPVYTEVVIAASSGGSTQNHTFVAVPPIRLRSITADKVVYDQAGGWAVVRLNGPVPTGGVRVDVSADSPLWLVDRFVTVPSGATETSVFFHVGQDHTPGTITKPLPTALKATSDGTTVTWNMTAKPGLVSITADLPGGWDIPDEFTARITLGGPADEEMPVTGRPAPNDDTLALVGSPVIPEGATTYDFRMKFTGSYRRVADITLFVAGRKVKFGINFGNVYLT